MNTPGQLSKRVKDLEGGSGEAHDIVFRIMGKTPNENEIIIWHMRGDKLQSHEVLTETEHNTRKGDI